MQFEIVVIIRPLSLPFAAKQTVAPYSKSIFEVLCNRWANAIYELIIKELHGNNVPLGRQLD